MPENLPPPSVVKAFQNLGARLDNSMYIVTCAHQGEKSGCLMGFATQISVYPPRYMVGLSKENHTHRIARAATHLCVHFPTSDQMDLASLFGGETGDEIDKFAHCAWHEGRHGVPVLDDCRHYFIGEIRGRVDAGDHEAMLLHVVEAACEGKPDFLHYRQVRDLHPGHAVETPPGYPAGSNPEDG